MWVMQNNSECYWYVSIKCTWSIKKDTKWNNKTWQVGAQYNQLRLCLKPPLTLATQKWWTVKWSGRQGATSPSTAWINPSPLPLMTTATSCCCMSPSPSSCQFIRTIYLVISVVPFSHSISGSSESWSILLNWDSWESKCVVVNSKKAASSIWQERKSYHETPRQQKVHVQFSRGFSKFCTHS